MRHKKYKLLHKVHSIPIINNLCKKKRLYLVSYSIPLARIGVLLLGGVIMINPELGDLFVSETNAVTIQDEWLVTNSSSDDSNISSKNNAATGDGVNSSSDSPDEEFGGFGDDDPNYTSGALSNGDENDGISTHWSILDSDTTTTFSPTIGLTISNTDQAISTVQGGSTAYGNYDVTLTCKDITNYTLSINTDSNNLTMPSGASSSTSTVSGVGTGTVGSSMGTNKWGYTVTDTSTNASSYSGLTYKSVPTSATQIASGNATSSYTVDVSKRLVFAARFAEEAAPGNYSAKITMSATATPLIIGELWSNGVDSEIKNMQDITQNNFVNRFCVLSVNDVIPVGSTLKLSDTRDGKTYTIVKLADGNCWMQQNLALAGGTKLTSADSDVNSDWTLPASANTSWDTSSNTAVQMKNGVSGMTVNSSNTGDGKGWQSNYGNYYSWCAATAESCKTNRTGSAITSGQATESICPKGWKLSTGNTNGQFYNALNGLNFTTVQADPYKFPAAGSIGTNAQLYYPGTNGYYWSRTSYSNANSAYRLNFYSGSFSPGTYYSNRYLGYSVRCVAEPAS